MISVILYHYAFRQINEANDCCYTVCMRIKPGILKRLYSTTVANQKVRILAFVLFFSGIGLMALFFARAASPSSSVEAENGSTTGRAFRTTASGASGGSYVKFGSGLSTTLGIAKIIGKTEDGKTKVFFNPSSNPANVSKYELLRDDIKVAELAGSQISAARVGNTTGVSAHLEVLSSDPALIASSTRSLDEIAADGYGYTRIDFYWSGSTEPSDQNFNWTAIDSAVDRAHARGLKVIAMPTYSPHWTRPAGTTDKTPPTDLNQYAEFVEAAVQRYGANSSITKYRTNPVRVWELWNEPNIRSFWQDPSNQNNAWIGPDNPLGYGISPTRYAEMIRLTYPRAKAKDPQALILVGGLVGPIEIGARDFLATIYYYHYATHGSEPVPFDGVAIHPYSSARHPLTYESWNAFIEVDNMRRLMESMGVGEATKPIWGTEASYSTVCTPSYKVCDIPSDAADGNLSQANLLAEAIYNWQLYKNVGPYNVYLYKDLGGSVDDIDGYYGVVKSDFTPKLAKAILKEVNKQIIIADSAPATGQNYSYQIRAIMQNGTQVTGSSVNYTNIDFRQ